MLRSREEVDKHDVQKALENVKDENEVNMMIKSSSFFNRFDTSHCG